MKERDLFRDAEVDHQVTLQWVCRCRANTEWSGQRSEVDS